ncbi:dynein regulatory complex subunit 2-like [Dunckerocampus dactyliophorus]|uniref:dynein regulatory complex subunit 2-like n=1 Tax=Dunckerocampus dactyliophorus TaxID=161453 RepID=UPI00240649F1|nr:dynein regulatory complex subunit 2-like [Dunckerocampus dactyliophorus]
MPKKGKGKKGKGAGDDPSLRPQILRDKLKKEKAYTAGNAVKLKDTYRLNLRGERCFQLKEDIAALRRTFERRDQDLNRAVERFACGVQESERLSAQVWRVHQENVERLRTLQEKRVRFLQEQWDVGQEVIGHRLEFLSKTMVTYFLQAQVGFEDTLIHLERHHQQALATIHRLYSEPMEAHSAYEKTKAFEVEECFLDQNVKVLKNQKAEKRYIIEKENVELMEMKKQVSVTTSKKGVALYNTIIEAQSRLETTEKSNSAMTAKLTAARNNAKAKIHMLLSQMARDRVPVQMMIKEISLRSNDAAKSLRTIITKGTRVLKLAEMCRHLESQQKGLVAARELAQESGTQAVQPSHMLEFPELKKRFNTAQVHQEALMERSRNLKQENQQLQLLKYQRTDAKTINSDTHNGPYNPLLVKLAPVMKNGDSKHRRCVVEGVHAIRTLTVNE